MDETRDQMSVNFCYCCGRRLSKQQDHCLFCSTPIRRRVRPARFCQFCGAQVPTEAVKCRHCGEWLDGREQAPASAAPAQTVFIIDGSLLHAGHDLRLPAGQPVPPQVAAALAPRTVKAIEAGQPQMIDQPGVRALLPGPSPQAGSDDIIDVPAVVSSSAQPPATQREVARGGAQAAGRGALVVGRAAVEAGRWLARRAAQAKASHDDQPIDVDHQDTYRTCAQCGAEILATDNFCYHCGVQYNVPERPRRRAASQPSNTGLYFLVLVALGAAAAMRILGLEPHPLAVPGVCAAAGVLSLAGFFRRRTFFSQALSLAGLAAAVALFLFLYF